MAERILKNVVSALKAYHHSSKTLWDTNIHWLQTAFNMSKHEAHKQTPFSIFMAYKPNNPLANMWCLKDLLPDEPTQEQIKDIWSRAKRNLFKSHQRRKEVYNRDRKPFSCKVGDKVMYKLYSLSNAAKKYSTKLASRFKGPYEIIKFLTPVTVLIKDDNNKVTRAHCSQLKII